MKKANFENSVSGTKIFSLLSVILLLVFYNSASAQCTLACNGTVNISVDANCEAALSADMFLNADGSSCPGGVFEIIIKNHHGTVTLDRFTLPATWDNASLYIKESVQYTIRDTRAGFGNNSCWGYANIEDKLPPIIDCDDITLLCCDAIDFSPVSSDDCSGVADVEVINQITEKGCDLGQNFVKRITRTVVASDKCGNVSETCTQVLTVERLFPLLNCNGPVVDPTEVGLDSIGLACPGDYDVEPGGGNPDLPPFICHEITDEQDMDGDGIPDPTLLGAGVPYLDKNRNGVFDFIDRNNNGVYDMGVDRPDGDLYLYPIEYNGEPYNTGESSVSEVLEFCNMAVTVEDILLSDIKCVKKIMRMWTVREWFCGDEGTKVCTQIIEITDPIGPKPKYSPHDFSASTNGYTCEARVRVPDLEWTDNCAWIEHIDIFWKNEELGTGGSILNFDSASEDEKYLYLPEGVDSVFYVAYDECHNVGRDTLIINVEDNTPPVAICEEHTVVSLTYDGHAEVPATVFDDGSYDDCGLKKMLARRMDPGCDCENHYPKFDNAHYLGNFEDALGNDHHYYLSKFKTIGRKAKQLSKAMGGYAVVFETRAEWEQVNTWVTPKLDPFEKYWIGLSDEDHEGTFEWENGHPYNPRGFDGDSTPSNDSYPWRAGNPDSKPNSTIGENLDCVAACEEVGFMWNDLNMTRDEYFIIEIDDPCGFSGYIPFCCEDVGENEMVVFRVVDKWGNFNDCMVEVEVQDKFEPYLECPPDLTIKCGFDYADLDLAFGKVVEGAENREAIIIPPMYLIAPTGSGSTGLPALWDGYAHDNCDVVITELDPDLSGLNQCGIGTLIRTWEAYHPNQPDNVAQCWQYITFAFDGDNYPIYDMTIDDPAPIMDCLDIDNTENSLSPDIWGYPEYPRDSRGRPIHETECDLVGFTYEDQLFPFNDPNGTACFKVVRNWKIIDWCNPCTFDQSEPCYRTPNGGPHELTQIFKINNKVEPVLTTPCDDVVFCTYDGTCSEGKVDLCMTAVDDCTLTENLSWSYSINYNYLENDGHHYDDDLGSFDYTNWGTGGKATLLNEHGTDLFPVGKHLIVWTFEDKCGNRTSCDQVLKIENCKAPTPYCIDGLAIDLMPVGEPIVGPDGNDLFEEGMIEIWASDFDRGSAHPCGYEVIHAFSEDPTDRNRTFTCADFLEIQRTGAPLEIDVYSLVVIGEGDHQQIISSYCTASLDVQNNMGIDCDRDGMTSTALISGSIETELSEELEGVEVRLEGSQTPMAMTDDRGLYAFPSMDIGGAYQVNPSKTDDPLNGISTLDIVLIQRHILGITSLDSPYKIIAGDINNDGGLTAFDLVELRKMILGVNMDFTNNESWRFVSNEYAFANPANPLSESFMEDYDIAQLANDMDVDFTALKVGDVNNSVNINGLASNENRSNRNLVLNIPAKKLNQGEVVNIPFTFNQAQNVYGYQFTLNFDPTQLEFIGYAGDKLELSTDNVGTNNVDKGMITMSWNDATITVAEATDILFYLNFKAIGNEASTYGMKLTSDITKAEAYTQNNEIVGLALETTNEGVPVTEFTLFQNTPNPFTNVTEIGFVLPESSFATLKIHNVTGKIIKTYQGNYAKGYNSIVVSKEDIGVAGVLYYTLETDEFNTTRRMVVIE